MRRFLILLFFTAAPVWVFGSVKTLEVSSQRYWTSIGHCNLDIMRLGGTLLRPPDGHGAAALPDAKKMGVLARAFKRDFDAFEKISPREPALKPLHNQLWNAYAAISEGTSEMAAGLKAHDRSRYKYFFFRTALYVRDARDTVARMELIEKRSSGDGFAAAKKAYSARMK